MKGLQNLKNKATGSEKEQDQALRETAKQFEALFVNQMMKSMRDAIPKSGLMQSNTMDTYQSMMDQQWSQHISEQGVGLADMMVEQLKNDQKQKDQMTELNTKK